MKAGWGRYYEAAGDDPRPTLLVALERFSAPGFAVDLGCGTGRDTFELLRRGWRVLAIDAERDAIERLLERAPNTSRLATDVARFDAATWGTADLVNASFALPFCPPDRFGALWGRIAASLRAGGRFSGQLFGEHDEWSSNPELTFHSRTQVERLLEPFDVERCDEEDEDGWTAIGDRKHWHVFHVVARRR